MQQVGVQCLAEVYFDIGLKELRTEPPTPQLVDGEQTGILLHYSQTD